LIKPSSSPTKKTSVSAKVGEFLFHYRSYTPIPLMIIILIFSKPTLGSILVGYPFVVCGELLRLWSAGHIGASSRTMQVGASHLVTSGPYGYIRNSLYVGNTAIACGETVSAGSLFPVMLLLVFAFLFIQYSLIIPVEEAKLALQFPQYDDYRRQVRRIIPRLSPYGEKGNADWLVGLRSERATLILRGLILVAIIGLGLCRGDLTSLQFDTIFN